MKNSLTLDFKIEKDDFWKKAFTCRELTFLRSSHRYLVPSFPCLPSISQIVSFYFKKDFSLVNPWVLKRALKRGNNIHKFVERLVKRHKVISVKDYFGEKKLLFEVLKKTFCSTHFLFSEIRLHNQEIAGTVDLIAIDHERQDLSVYDVKTGSYFDPEGWSLQLNLYSYLLTDYLKTITQRFKSSLMAEKLLKDLITKKIKLKIFWVSNKKISFLPSNNSPFTLTLERTFSDQGKYYIHLLSVNSVSEISLKNIISQAKKFFCAEKEVWEAWRKYKMT